MVTRSKFYAVFVAVLCLGLRVSFGGVAVERLRCEYLENPLGIDSAQPRLSWIIKSEQRNQKQTSYQIRVAPTKANLDARDARLLWDSGKVDSDESIGVLYAGERLASMQSYFWKVRLWDK